MTVTTAAAMTDEIELIDTERAVKLPLQRAAKHRSAEKKEVERKSRSRTGAQKTEQQPWQQQPQPWQQ